MIALIYRELHTDHPIVDLFVFKDRSFATGVFLMTVVGFVLYGSLVLLPIMLQTLLGYSAVEAGEAMAPRGIGSLIMMPLVGALTAKVDARKLLMTGLVIGGVTMLWLGELNLNAGYWDIFWPQFLQGAGLALLFVPLTTVSMATIAPQRMGNATSLFNLMRNIGGSVGIALTGTYLQRHRQVVSSALGENINVYDPVSRSMIAQITNGLIAAGVRRRHRDAARLRHSRGHALPAGVDGDLCHHLPDYGSGVSADDPAGVHHEATETRRGARRCALGEVTPWREVGIPQVNR